MASAGIDVSHHNGAIDWAAVAGAGTRFAMIKATDGQTGHDSAFAANWANAKAAGVLRGAYHFLRPTSAVDKQVQNFIHVVGALEDKDLAPALDMEDPDLWAEVENPADWAVRWLEAIAAHYNRKPYFYSSPDFIKTVLKSDSRLATYPLWLARWASAPEPIPAPWKTWALWQYTDEGSVSGIAGKVDRDRSKDDL